MKDGLINIELGGKERALKFNMRAIEIFSEIKNPGKGSVSASATLIYAGLMGWCYAKQLDPDFTFEDVVEWTEELVFTDKTDVIESADKCFAASRAFEFYSGKAKKKKKK